MSKPTRREPEPPPVITDKRHTARPPLPTAQEMLDEEQPVEMTEEQKAALLAKQAEELEEIPYEGAGVKVDAKAEVPQFLTAFTVLVPRDGPPQVVTPHIGTDEETGEPDFAVDREAVQRDMYLACTEIARGINMAEQAQFGVMANMGAAAGMAKQQAAARDAAQAIKRASKKG